MSGMTQSCRHFIFWLLFPRCSRGCAFMSSRDFGQFMLICICNMAWRMGIIHPSINSCCTSLSQLSYAVQPVGVVSVALTIKTCLKQRKMHLSQQLVVQMSQSVCLFFVFSFVNHWLCAHCVQLWWHGWPSGGHWKPVLCYSFCQDSPFHHGAWHQATQQTPDRILRFSLWICQDGRGRGWSEANTSFMVSLVVWTIFGNPKMQWSLSTEQVLVLNQTWYLPKLSLMWFFKNTFKNWFGSLSIDSLGKIHKVWDITPLHVLAEKNSNHANGMMTRNERPHHHYILSIIIVFPRFLSRQYTAGEYEFATRRHLLFSVHIRTPHPSPWEAPELSS